MGVRGNRFARARESRRDDHGRSLPSDRSMQFVGIELICGRCNRERGEHVVLGSWAIENHFPEFRAQEVFDRGPGRAMTTEVIRGDDGPRVRVRLRCPKCSSNPQFRRDRIDQALEGLYAPGRVHIASHPV